MLELRIKANSPILPLLILKLVVMATSVERPLNVPTSLENLAKSRLVDPEIALHKVSLKTN